MADKRTETKSGFLLRLFLFSMFVVAFVFVAWTVIKQRYDSRLIREIREMGGTAEVNPVVSMIWSGEAGEAPRISFIRRVIDSTSQWFQTRDQAVCHVDLNGCSLDSMWLPRLTRATELQVLFLDDTQVGPELAELRQNTHLEWLYLSGPDIGHALRHVSQLSQLESIAIWGKRDVPTELSSQDLATLVDLRSLKRLGLSHVSVRDEGLEQIGRMKSLERLELYSNSESTSEGLQYLGSLGELRELSLQSIPIGDQGLSCIKKLSKLKSLYVICPSRANGSAQWQEINLPPVTDASLEDICDLSQLQKLYLESAHLSDDCIEHLVKLQQLRSLTINNSQISREGLARLEVALPACTIRLND